MGALPADPAIGGGPGHIQDPTVDQNACFSNGHANIDWRFTFPSFLFSALGVPNSQTRQLASVTQNGPEANFGESVVVGVWDEHR